MTRILILEDSEESLKALTAMAESVSDKVTAVPVKSLEEARCALKDADSPFQAFLLDINLDINDDSDISGITFANEVRAIKQYAFTPIVMITSFASMELRAYRELHCYQYLVKPYSEEDVKALIGRLLFMSQPGEARERFITVKKSGINYKLFCKDIICLKAVPRGVCFMLADGELNIPYVTIKQLLEKLPGESFVQIHRMCVINADYIENVDFVNGIIALKGGITAEVGVTFKNKLRYMLAGGDADE